MAIINIYEMVKNNRKRKIILERERDEERGKLHCEAVFRIGSKSEDNLCRTVDIEVQALLHSAIEW